MSSCCMLTTVTSRACPLHLMPQLLCQQVQVGEMLLKGHNSHLEISKHGGVIAKFTAEHDRLVVYRNMDDRPPYWFFNRNGDAGEHRG